MFFMHKIPYFNETIKPHNIYIYIYCCEISSNLKGHELYVCENEYCVMYYQPKVTVTSK